MTSRISGASLVSTSFSSVDGHRDERRVEQLGPVEPGDGEQAGEVERPRDGDDLAAVDVELFDEQLEHVRVDRLLDLETHRWAEAST